MTIVTPATMPSSSSLGVRRIPSHSSSNSRVSLQTHSSSQSQHLRKASAVSSSFMPAATTPTSSFSLAAPAFKTAKKKWRVDPCSPPKTGWDNYVYAVSLGVGLGVGMTLFSLFREAETVYAEAAPQDSAPSQSGTKFGLDQVTLICLVGVPKSGKSTQAKKLPGRFEGFRVIDGSSSDFSLESLTKEVESSAAAAANKGEGEGEGEGKESLVILDGYPHSLEEAKAIESKLCPIFVVLYFDLPRNKFSERNDKKSSNNNNKLDEKDWDRAAEKLEPLVKHFRHRGNILEISADWDSHEEVWEQVEAKVEQVLELKAMGEDVSVA